MNSLRFGSRHTFTGLPVLRIHARVPLVVDTDRHRVAAAEEPPRMLRLGQRQLIVQRHAARRPLGPEPQQRFERDNERRAGPAQRLALLVLELHVASSSRAARSSAASAAA